VKETGGLAPQMQSADFRGASFQTECAARQRDCLLNKRAQLFRFWQSGYDAIFARIYQRSREVPQHGDAVLCGSPELPMGLKMTHYLLSYCTAMWHRR
jgi:hypothetical protein